MVSPQLLGGDGGEADAVGDRARVPRLTDAEPSILPTFMLATIWAGGMVMSETSRSGLMPPDASQKRIHIACVPGG